MSDAVWWDLPTELALLLNQPKFDGLQTSESEVLRAWIVNHAAEFDRIAFNVRIGTGLAMPEDTEPAIQKMAIDLTQKRADCIAQRGDMVAIVEVKLRLTMTTLGQLLGYSTIWKAENPDTRTVKLYAVGRDARLDAPDVLMAYGVNVELFPTVSTITVTPSS